MMIKKIIFKIVNFHRINFVRQQQKKIKIIVKYYKLIIIFRLNYLIKINKVHFRYKLNRNFKKYCLNLKI